MGWAENEEHDRYWREMEAGMDTKTKDRTELIGRLSRPQEPVEFEPPSAEYWEGWENGYRKAMEDATAAFKQELHRFKARRG